MIGTLEIIVPHMTFGEESIGLRFDQPSIDDLPALLEGMGITDLQPQDTSDYGERAPQAAWRGTASDGRTAHIAAWEDVPFDETAIGKALASGAIPPE